MSTLALELVGDTQEEIAKSGRAVIDHKTCTTILEIWHRSLSPNAILANHKDLVDNQMLRSCFYT